MLQITVPAGEQFDPASSEFIETAETALTLEHSLRSLSKWESKWKKPFLGKNGQQSALTGEELADYVRCMTLTKHVDPNVYRVLTADNIRAITDYINDPMTATTFSDKTAKSGRQTVTAEILYYQMVAFQIPFECQNWHLNKLLALIHVCSIKNAPPKKMSKKGIANQNRSLNAARRKASGSNG